MALKNIKLQNSDKTFIIDEEDYPKIANLKWYLNPKGYVQTSVYNPKTKKQDIIPLHKLIVEYPLVDHKDRDKLNNCKANLRQATRSQNMMNREKFKNRKTTSKYKGVHYVPSKNKWCATIGVDNVQITLGYFDTEEQAGHKYNLKALELHKEFAVLNDVPPVELPFKYKGIRYDKRRNKYIASLMYNGEQVLWKRFNTLEEALKVRNEYARKYNLKEQEYRG